MEILKKKSLDHTDPLTLSSGAVECTDCPPGTISGRASSSPDDCIEIGKTIVTYYENEKDLNHESSYHE